MKSTLFEPLCGKYADGAGRFSAVGWALSQLNVPEDILAKLKTDRPFAQLREVGYTFFTAPCAWQIEGDPEREEGHADRLCGEIEKFSDSGNFMLCSILLAHLLQVYEPWLSCKMEEIDYVRLRLKVLESMS
jgi:hypothetical protein